MLPKTISLSEFVRGVKRTTHEIETGTIYRIKRPGNRSLLLVDEERYEGWMAAFEFMQRPNWRAELDEAERDAVEGRLHDLDNVLTELGLEDGPHRKSSKAAQRVASALRSLRVAPRSGPSYPDESELAGKRLKTVHVRRRWSYRVTYVVRPTVMIVLTIVVFTLAR